MLTSIFALIEKYGFPYAKGYPISSETKFAGPIFIFFDGILFAYLYHLMGAYLYTLTPVLGFVIGNSGWTQAYIYLSAIGTFVITEAEQKNEIDQYFHDEVG